MAYLRYFICIVLIGLSTNLTGIDLRHKVLATAESNIGLKELTGNNDGEICKFHKSLGYNCGLPWCAIFGKYCLVTNGVPTIMDARAVSIKKDKEATHTMVGGMYWYPTQYGTGHTGFVYSWEKKNSDKFIGLDGNLSDRVRFVQRSKRKHAKYISDPYPQSTSQVIIKKRKKKPDSSLSVSNAPPEDVALLIDDGTIISQSNTHNGLRFKLIAVLCTVAFILNMVHERFEKRYRTNTSEGYA